MISILMLAILLVIPALAVDQPLESSSGEIDDNIGIYRTVH